MNDAGWAWWVVMTIGMVALWALVIYGIVWLARSSGGQGFTQRDQEESADEMLKRRLAAGAISVEEYERVRQTLAGQAPAEHPDRVPAEHAEPAVH